MNHKIYLIIGGNIGRVFNNIKLCVYYISKYLGCIINISSLYITEPWRMSSKKFFLNIIIVIKTADSPIKLLKYISMIEFFLGKKINNKLYYKNRKIDIDILLYDDMYYVSRDLLCIPHFFLYKRKFVLIPLCELSPFKKHPVLNISFYYLLLKCNDFCKVIKANTKMCNFIFSVILFIRFI